MAELSMVAMVDRAAVEEKMNSRASGAPASASRRAVTCTLAARARRAVAQRLDPIEASS